MQTATERAIFLRERAALEWTEALTLIRQNHIPDAFFERMKKFFSEKELVDLTLAVVRELKMRNHSLTFEVQAQMAIALAKLVRAQDRKAERRVASARLGY